MKKPTKQEEDFAKNIQIEVVQADCYRLKTCAFSRKPKHIVDLGFNMGSFSKHASALHPEATIYAYELLGRNIEVAQQIVVAECNNVKVHHAAVIGNSRITSILTGKDNLGGNKVTHEGSSFYLSEEKIPQEIYQKYFDTQSIAEELNQYTLEDIILDNNIDYVDFLKMDIEGSEYEVLEHFFETGLCKRVLNLALEIHGTRDLLPDGKTAKEFSKQYLWLEEKIKENFDNYTLEPTRGYGWASNKMGDSNE